MSTTEKKPRVTSFARQFLVDDLERSIEYYKKLGFQFGEPWESFYAIGYLDGLELHLKEAPKNQDERRRRRENEHLDAAAGVDGIEAFFEQSVANGATILKPLEAFRDRTLVVNLPGSPGGCRDGFAVVRPALRHGLELAAGGRDTPHRQT